jgi:hypothetical protein
MVASSTPFAEISVEPDLGTRNRATVFFRLILLIPVFILAALLSGDSLFSWDDRSNGEWNNGNSGMAGTALYFAVALVIIFAGKYPNWLLTFMHGLQAFQLRVGAYALLLRDEYPALEDRYYAALFYPEIEGGAKLNRLLPIVKWFLAIPHYIWLAITGIGVFFVTLLAWFGILLTGRYPSGFANFVIGWLRYYNRVFGYAFTLVTDKYPAFSLR